MLGKDVINRLRAIVPQHTERFCDVEQIASISSTAGVVTITTSQAHGIEVGKGIAVSGTVALIPSSSLSRSGVVGTLITSVDHDLTEGIAPTITIEGSSSSDFNGTFTVINIDNRRTIQFSMLDQGDTSATGGQLINGEAFNQSFNGYHEVTGVPSTTSLTFAYTGSDDLIGRASTGILMSKLRIAGSATLERAKDMYTEQEQTKSWMFVVMGNVTASKSRFTQTDLTHHVQKGEYYRQILQQFVSIYVVSNTKEELGARATRDDMQELLLALTKAIAFHQFPTNLNKGQTDPLVFVEHGVLEYDSAMYIHEFTFECGIDLTFNDTSGYSPDVAFRDIQMDLDPDFGTTGTVSDINLDEEPLP